MVLNSSWIFFGWVVFVCELVLRTTCRLDVFSRQLLQFERIVQQFNPEENYTIGAVGVLDFHDLNILNHTQHPQQTQTQDQHTDIVQLLHNYIGGNYNGQQQQNITNSGQKNQGQPKNYENPSTLQKTFSQKQSSVEIYPQKVMDYVINQIPPSEAPCNIREQLNDYVQNCNYLNQNENTNFPCLSLVLTYFSEIENSLQRRQKMSGTFFAPSDTAFEHIEVLNQKARELLLYHIIPAEIELQLPNQNQNNDNYDDNNMAINTENGGGDRLMYDKMVVPIGPQLNNSLGDLGDLITDRTGHVKLWGSEATVLKGNLRICSMVIHIVDSLLIPDEVQQSLLQTPTPSNGIVQPFNQYLEPARTAIDSQESVISASNFSVASSETDDSSLAISIPPVAIIIPPVDTFLGSLLNGIRINDSDNDPYVQTITASEIGLSVSESPSNESSQHRNNT